MLANTLTITISGTGYTLTRINQDNFGSLYRFSDATQLMELQVRHSDEPVNGLKQPEPVRRHNMFFEHTVYATPTANRKYYSVSHTMRQAMSSDPAALTADDAGFVTLEGSIRAQLVAGEP